jgi:hypothetical protein
MTDRRTKKAVKTASKKKTPAKRKLKPASVRMPEANRPATAATPVATTGKHFLSDKVGHFTESVIREMTRQAMLYHAVNLAQGFPDFSAPAEIK